MKRYPPFPHVSRYRWLLLLTILLALIAVLPLTQRAERQDQRPQRQPLSTPLERSKKKQLNAVPGEILVRFRPASKGLQLGRQVVVEKTGRQIGLSIKAVSPALEIVEGLRVAQVNPDDTSNAIEALRARPDVVYAEPNFIRKAFVTPNDPRYPEMWGLNNTGQPSTFGGNPGSAGNDIRAEQAWNITTGNRSVVVGVIDTGIDINHEDLHDNIWTNPGEVAGNGLDDDGNGFVDDVHGWDFVHNDATVFDYTLPTFPPPASYTGDVDDHGTHVAGTIGATGNNVTGVTGVNWQVSLMSLKFLADDGAGSSSDLLNAFAYAKAMRQLWDSSGGTKGANIRVLNNSYGGDNFSQSELDAIRALSDAGILFVTQTGLRLTNLTGDSRPRYSPDASKIVFQSNRDGQPEIYVMNSDGTAQTRLTNNSAADTAPPAWSPDGTKILFTSLRDGPTSPALYVMNVDGSAQTRVTAGSDGVWRPTPTTPVIFTEEGTNNAAAFNSATFVRGPFRIPDTHNFSFDNQTRVMLFTSNLGLASPPIPAPSILSVQAKWRYFAGSECWTNYRCTRHERLLHNRAAS